AICLEPGRNVAGVHTLEGAFQYRDLACVKLCGNIFRGQQHLSQMADQAEAGDVGQSVNGKAAVGCWLLAVRKNVVGRWSLVVGCGAWLRGADEGVSPYVVRGDHFGGGLVR